VQKSEPNVASHLIFLRKAININCMVAYPVILSFSGGARRIKSSRLARHQ
jgi:hypothetical protein